MNGIFYGLCSHILQRTSQVHLRRNEPVVNRIKIFGCLIITCCYGIVVLVNLYIFQLPVGVCCAALIDNLPLTDAVFEVLEEQRCCPIAHLICLGVTCPAQISTCGSEILGCQLRWDIRNNRLCEAEVIQVERIAINPFDSHILGARGYVNVVFLPFSAASRLRLPCEVCEVFGSSGVSHLEFGGEAVVLVRIILVIE